MTVVEYRSRVPVPVEQLFQFHESSEALGRLLPPWQKARVISKDPGLFVGVTAVIETQLGPFRGRIVARHTAFEPPRMFQDTMQKGPFRRWIHTHRFEPDGSNASWLIDHIEYQLPLEPVSRWVVGAWVRRELERLFRYRHEVTTRTLCDASVPDFQTSHSPLPLEAP